MRRSPYSKKINRPQYPVLCTLVMGVAYAATAPVQTVNLAATTSPAAGQPGITILTLTGSNFPTGTIGVTNVAVHLSAAVPNAGPALTAQVSAVQSVVGSSRRITFQIAGPNVSTPVSYQCSLSGATAEGTTFASNVPATLIVNPPPSIASVAPNTGSPGQTVTVTINAAYTNFVQGATQASFGAGISVGGGTAGGFGAVTVVNPTTATVQLTIDPAARGRSS